MNANNKTKFFNNQIVWLDSREAAEYLRISVENLRVKVSRGEIPVHGRLGRCLRFRREELDKMLSISSSGEFSND
jgi:excisionase family DNA binding protein